MWNLYFLDSIGKKKLVKKDIKYTGTHESLRLIQDIVKEDISKRRPDFRLNFNSNYMETQNDEHDEILIEYGSCREFYLLSLKDKE